MTNTVQGIRQSACPSTGLGHPVNECGCLTEATTHTLTPIVYNDGKQFINSHTGGNKALQEKEKILSLS